MKANSIGELFGTLQQSIVDEWRKHLKTSKYSKHMALDEFYTEMPELVDQLIEDYQAINGIVDDYKNVFDASTMNALEYLEELRTFVKESRPEFIEGEPELESDLDNILSMIDSTIYKVRELKENKIMSLKNYLLESLNINEAEDKNLAAYKGLMKVDKAIAQGKLGNILGDLNADEFSIWDDEDGWNYAQTENIITHFVGWCVMAFEQLGDAEEWWVNIVDHKAQYLDEGFEDFLESYGDGEDEDELRTQAEYVISTIFPMVYKKITHHDIKLWK